MNKEINNSMNDDLDWIAFRYVSGEMDESESFAFESRLAEDQLAREAVASAVELTHTVSASARSDYERHELKSAHKSNDTSKPRRLSRPVFLTALIAVSVSGLLVASIIWHIKTNATVAGVDSSEDTKLNKEEQLTRIWIENRQLWNEWEFVDTPDSMNVRDEFDLADDTTLIQNDEESVDIVSAPNWMLVGLRGHESNTEFPLNDAPLDRAPLNNSPLNNPEEQLQ